VARIKPKKKKKKFRFTRDSLILSAKIGSLFIIFVATAYLYRFAYMASVSRIFSIILAAIAGAVGLAALFYLICRYLIKSKKAAGWADTFLFSAFIIFIIYVLAVAAGNFNLSNDVSRTLRGGQKIVAALEEYRKDKDSYPENLSELVPDYLTKLRKTSMGFGGDYAYELLEDGKCFTITFPTSGGKIRRYYSKEKLWKQETPL